MTFRTECAQRIAQIRNDTNVTLQTLLQQHEEQSVMVHEYNNMLQQQKQQELTIETKCQERLAESQQRENTFLEEQRALVTKQDECVQSKTTLYEQLRQYQQNELNEKLQLHNITSECEILRNTILEKEKTIGMIQSDNEHQFTKLSTQLNLTKRMLHEKIEEVERLNSMMGNDTHPVSSRSTNHHRLSKDMTQIHVKDN